MSAVRSSFVRASRAVTRSNLTFVKTARPLATSARLYQREIIAEKEIPTASFITDDKQPVRTSIHVRDDPEIEVPVEVDEVNVKPLSRDLYQKLPNTMQKMTVMDKVVIVTG